MMIRIRNIPLSLLVTTSSHSPLKHLTPSTTVRFASFQLLVGRHLLLHLILGKLPFYFNESLSRVSASGPIGFRNTFTFTHCDE
jgi:hypothetical protein